MRAQRLRGERHRHVQSQRVEVRFERGALRRSAAPIMEAPGELVRASLGASLGRALGRSARLAALAALVVLALGAVACTGIVVEPADESVGSGNQKFWGYSLGPGDSIKLEALNSSSAYETIATTTSSTAPSSAGDYTGYYFEVWTNLTSLPTRFRKPGPWAGYSAGTFRITVGGTVMQTRLTIQNSSTPSSESWLVNYWQKYSSSSNTTRVYFTN